MFQKNTGKFLPDSMVSHAREKRCFCYTVICYSISGIYEWNMSMQHLWNYTGRGKLKNSEETCPTTLLSATDFMQTGLGPNLGLHSHRAVTARFCHDAASHPTGLYTTVRISNSTWFVADGWSSITCHTVHSHLHKLKDKILCNAKC